MATVGDYLYRGEHRVHRVVESLCRTLEINITLYIHYTSITDDKTTNRHPQEQLPCPLGIHKTKTANLKD